MPKASIPTPYRYDLDTSGLSEALHELKLQAVSVGRIYESAPLGLVVDRTRPTLVGWVPASGAKDVWVKDGVKVVFSEGVTAASVRASLQCTWGGTAVACDVSVASVDGTTYRAVPLLGVAQLADGQLGAALTGPVNDLAGNQLLAGPSWTGSVPTWQLPGGVGVASVSQRWDHTGPNVVLDAQARPVVAYSVGGTNPSGAAIQVSRFDGSRWNVLGSPFPGKYEASVDLDASGQPVVAAFDAYTGSRVLAVWRFGEAAVWSQLGGSLLRDSSNTATFPVVRVPTSGAPVVAWMEGSGGANVANVSQWNVSQWQPLGAAVNTGAVQPNGPFPPVALVLEASRTPVVAWREVDGAGTVHAFVRRWDAAQSAWSAAVEPMIPSAGCSPHTLVVVADKPHLVCTWSDPGSQYRAVLRLDSWSTPSWSMSGADARASDAAAIIGHAVVGDSVLIAWRDSNGARFASRYANPIWTTQSAPLLGDWKLLGASNIIADQVVGANAQSYGNFLAGPDGTLALAFETNDSSAYRVWVKRFNR